MSRGAHPEGVIRPWVRRSTSWRPHHANVYLGKRYGSHEYDDDTTGPTSASPKIEVDKAALDGATPKDLLPTKGNYPTESVRYRSVVVTDIPGAKPARKLTGAIGLGEENLPFHDRPAEGMIVTTEQSWSAPGVTLGRLLHGLALAPGQSTEVAVVDWQRSTKATGTETTAEADTLSATTDQNRSISEVANAIAPEEQYGTSQANYASRSSSSAAASASRSSGSAAATGASRRRPAPERAASRVTANTSSASSRAARSCAARSCAARSCAARSCRHSRRA
ncbi:hypothetical protein [Kitasatospora sp. NPDC096140]|uniref:hypothetical protein n=1 Tax=Kitasatospora sp. NPDC096140 TaxID=3155425 RepID=UPI0033178915